MVTSQTCKLEDAFLNPTLMAAWTSVVHPSPEVSSLAQRQVQFYTSELKIRDPYSGQLVEDGPAVERAQMFLKSMNGPEKIFRGLVEQVNRDQQRDTLRAYADNYNEVLSGPDAVDGAYTRNGWHMMMDRIHSRKFTSVGDPCVLGGGGGSLATLSVDAMMQRDVEALYVRSYVSYWQSFLAAHHVLNFSGIPDGTRKLHTLADNNRSPLLALVYMTSHNTDLTSAQSGEPKVLQTLEQMKESAKKGLGSYLDRFGQRKQAAGAGTVTAKQAPVPTYEDLTAEFQPVHAMVDSGSPDQWLNPKNQDYIKDLELLSQALAALPARPDPKNQADVEAVANAYKAEQDATTALHTLTGNFVNTRSQVDVNLKALLEEPLRYSADLLRHLPPALPQLQAYTAEAKLPPPPGPAQAAQPSPAPVPTGPPPPPPPDVVGPVKVQVNRSAEDLCHSLHGLRDKYPFNERAPQEASIQDLNAVFAPVTGSLAQFVHTLDVSRVYELKGREWVPNPAFPATFSQPFLGTLNSLQQFSDELYPDEATSPHFEYSLELNGTGKMPFELDEDAHILTYNPKKGGGSCACPGLLLPAPAPSSCWRSTIWRFPSKAMDCGVCFGSYRPRMIRAGPSLLFVRSNSTAVTNTYRSWMGRGIR
jgi:type VI protein secretion system component VasK